MKNLIGIGTVLGVQGAATDKIKDLLAGRELSLSPEEIPVNALEALGISMYDYNRMADSGPIEAIARAKTPPIIRMSADVWSDPHRSIRYVPIAGRAVYDRFKEPIEADRKERRKKRGYKIEITVPAKKTSDKRTS